MAPCDPKTVDEVVFALPGEPTLLGAHTLDGFNAIVDLRRRRLVAGGPMPAAAAQRSGPRLHVATRAAHPDGMWSRVAAMCGVAVFLLASASGGQV
jgi:hypothetical protein